MSVSFQWVLRILTENYQTWGWLWESLKLATGIKSEGNLMWGLSPQLYSNNKKIVLLYILKHSELHFSTLQSGQILRLGPYFMSSWKRIVNKWLLNHEKYFQDKDFNPLIQRHYVVFYFYIPDWAAKCGSICTEENHRNFCLNCFKLRHSNSDSWCVWENL